MQVGVTWWTGGNKLKKIKVANYSILKFVNFAGQLILNIIFFIIG